MRLQSNPTYDTQCIITQGIFTSTAEICVNLFHVSRILPYSFFYPLLLSDFNIPLITPFQITPLDNLFLGHFAIKVSPELSF